MPRHLALLLFLTSAICGVATGKAHAQPTTVLTNGSFSSPPTPWMTPGAPEYETIGATYGAPPVQSYWLPCSNVWPPLYVDIWGGRFALANSLNSQPAGDLNLITHSHGGNVAIMATYYMNRPLRHLINLGTPINWDLPGVLGTGFYSRCQISSSADWVQFIGASPYQVGNFFYDIYRSIQGAYEAFQALIAGDYDTAYAYFASALFEVIDAEYWWYSTKIEVQGPTYMFSGLSHGDLHEPPVWNAIRNYCAVN